MAVLPQLLALLVLAAPSAQAAPAPSPAPPRADSARAARPDRPAPASDSTGERDARWRLTFGGEARTRAEAVSNFQLGAGPDRRDTYGTTRLVLGAQADAGPFALAVEGRHAASHGRELPGGGRRPSDHDVWDVQTANVSVRCCGDAPVVVRAGRQPLVLGKQRLIGVSDWSNARRAFDGVHVGAGAGEITAEAFRARPVVVRPTEANRRDSTTVLTGAVLTGPDALWQLYALDYDQRRATGRHHRYTLGARAVRAAAARRPGFDVEGAWQDGRQDGRRVAAWFVATELSALLPVAWRTELALGLDAASGDADAGDATVQTFHVPFASAHSHGGYTDVVGRPNAVEARLVATTQPTARLQLRGAAHRFARLRLSDAVYAKSGAPLAAFAHSRDVGTEVDLTATLRAARGLRVIAGYGTFAPGAALRDVPGGARTMQWGFVGTTYEF